MRRWASRRNQWRSGLSNGPLEPWIRIKDRIYISHSRARGKDEGRGDSRQMTIAKKIALITGGKIHKEERETPLSSLGRRQRARHRQCTHRGRISNGKSASRQLLRNWRETRFSGTDPRRRQRWVNVRFGLKLQAEFRIGGDAPLSFFMIDSAY
jgi:hypothetical protein